MNTDPKVVIVVALGKNRAIGKEGKLLWHIPDDLKRFKELTMGHPIIMGRKTFESIVSYIGGPLPGRVNIVVTRDPDWTHDGVTIARSLEDALSIARSLNPTEIHIGGGAQLYEQALPYVDRLCLTLIDDEKDADTFFPPYETEFTTQTFREDREYNGLKYSWVDHAR
jgi:dihydrofolate reductase